MSPDYSSTFEYGGHTIAYDWYTVTDKKNIPSLPWKQIYVIGNLDGMVPLVSSATSEKPHNLPGGTVEPGETLDQTLKRELIEECNMRVIDWEPLGYQICTNPDGTRVPQFRAYARLEKIGEFIHDPGGNVMSNTLVHIDEVETYIKYGEGGERLVSLAKPYFVKEPV